jgi:hypothetical protein
MHDDVALRVRTHEEDMLADLREATLPVERDRARVAFPDAKPEVIGTARHSRQPAERLAYVFPALVRPH